MSERTDFLKWVETELRDAETAIHNGDAAPRRAIWSRQEPVTVFGAWLSGTTSAEVDHVFERLADSFSGCTSYAYDLISADAVGDLGYTVGHEHTSASVNGEPRTYTLRVTQLYRRESGNWKVFHRHADTLEPGN
ncbi:nuclear transport factor 2 family protein [Kribbella sp. NPDC000426]|uniref:nuclear transport factor 2 family protein n=1 Tax=Kribbella sp. NPDC000426 TaxID=3154255 RepID=UPI00332E0D91